MAKKIIISIVIVLLALALVFTICFASIPTFNNWCKGLFGKDSSTNTSINLVKLESGQVIKGVKFDITKEPDFSGIESPILYNGLFPLFDFEDEYSKLEDDPIIYFVDFEVIGKYLGIDLKGKVLGYFNGFNEYLEDVIYADRDIRVGGKFAEELGLSFNIKKGWNKEILNENNELLFNERIKVVNTYHADSWNGIYVGAIESEFCNHKVIVQGACAECNKCFHDRLNLHDKCRSCGSEIKASYILHDFDYLPIAWKSTIEQVFNNTVIRVYSHDNNQEYMIRYPDFTVQNFDSSMVGDCYLTVTFDSIETSFSMRIVCNDDYHQTLAVGQTCPSCGNFENYLVSIINIHGLPETFDCTESDLYNLEYITNDFAKKYFDEISINCVDSFGNIHDYRNDYVTYGFEIDYEHSLLVINFDYDYLSNYQTLQYKLPLNIMNSEVEE